MKISVFVRTCADTARVVSEAYGSQPIFGRADEDGEASNLKRMGRCRRKL